AIIIDLVFGEPPIKFHPTVWMGRTIAFLKTKFKSKNAKIEKLNGVFMAIITISLFTIIIYLLLLLIRYYLGYVVYLIISIIILKTTFAIKSMEQHTIPIMESIESGNLPKARKYVSLIVSREVSKLNEKQVISATIESIAENIVDGITSPFFYYAFFGIPGAIAYRVINTLDSMVGYKDEEHMNIGWFSAKIDMIANYIPARLTAITMIIASFLLGKDYKNAWKILLRDKDKVGNPVSGWTMSAMAGALGVKLEKPAHYVLGDPMNELRVEHILDALKIMKLTSMLFLVLIFVLSFIYNMLVSL
ncbi:MAG TPA: cobalamin biosynthesis protein, partial [Candidatus Atribacteria bacterium]|nr:cobalamin biosynthesis protein [Candidatus Atribacteria bacterium]